MAGIPATFLSLMKIESKKIDGITVFTVSNEKISFSVMDYGCTITNLFVKDKNKNPVDIVLGVDSVSDWYECTDSRGAIVGRVANRIRNGEFSLNGKKYSLDKNDGLNTLHSGKNRFEKMMWNSEILENGIRFFRLSKSMEQGFPGNVQISVEYTLSENELKLEYTATTDEETPLNLTNHAYFNLNGEGKILDHEVQLDCDEYLEIDSSVIPTGKILPVKDTIFDFTKGKKIGRDISLCDEKIGGGYDNCFVTKGDESELVRVGSVFSEKSGIRMEIFTNQKGIQVYSGNWLSGTKGKNGKFHEKYDGICFETQRFPNGVNIPEFPSSILKVDQKYKSVTVLRFE